MFSSISTKKQVMSASSSSDPLMLDLFLAMWRKNNPPKEHLKRLTKYSEILECM